MSACTSMHTCQSEAVTITGVTLARQSGPQLSLLIDLVWAELDRSNFNRADFGLCQCCDRVAEMLRFDWQIVSWTVPLFVLFLSLFVCVCVRARVLFDWLLTCLNLPFFGSGVDWTLSSPSISSAEITSPYIMSGAAGLSGVADPDKRTEPTAFSRLNHPTYPWVCVHNSLSVLHSFMVNFHSVTVTLIKHILGVFCW